MLGFRSTFSRLDLSARGRARVVVLTALGTLLCIAVAFAVDSFSVETWTWHWGSDPVNNLVIPLLLAPPFFFFLLNKLRELAEAHHELLVVSATDSLTSLLNRRAFTALVDAYLEKAEARLARTTGGLLVIDVDHFKAVNDSFGHESGDEALKLIADTIRSAVRETDIVGRLGGEEFCVFLPSGTVDATKQMAERIRLAVRAAPFAPEGKTHPLSVSVGGAHFEWKASFSDLYRHADRKLYSAKRNGRNRVEIDDLAAGTSRPPPAAALALH
ncbi:MAG: GGDEF domain-containing protein [Methylobacterium mesophilicum]|nr:GGDEF domain-containing protein [Methylobacterium mesophilicum]